MIFNCRELVGHYALNPSPVFHSSPGVKPYCMRPERDGQLLSMQHFFGYKPLYK